MMEATLRYKGGKRVKVRDLEVGTLFSISGGIYVLTAEDAERHNSVLVHPHDSDYFKKLRINPECKVLVITRAVFTVGTTPEPVPAPGRRFGIGADIALRHSPSVRVGHAVRYRPDAGENVLEITCFGGNVLVLEDEIVDYVQPDGTTAIEAFNA